MVSGNTVVLSGSPSLPLWAPVTLALEGPRAPRHYDLSNWEY
jgi:hypothetical protein